MNWHSMFLKGFYAIKPHAYPICLNEIVLNFHTNYEVGKNAVIAILPKAAKNYKLRKHKENLSLLKVIDTTAFWFVLLNQFVVTSKLINKACSNKKKRYICFKI